MTWLESIDRREAQRLARVFQNYAGEVRDDASERIASLARQTGKTLAPRVKDARHLADATREDASEQVAALARQTREMIEPHLRHARDVVRHEAPVVADAALKQAARMASAARRDPVPVVVGAVGLVLLASLVFGRRRT